MNVWKNRRIIFAFMILALFFSSSSSAEIENPKSTPPPISTTNSLTVFNVIVPVVTEKSATVIFRANTEKNSVLYVDYKKCADEICDTSWTDFDSQLAFLYNRYHAEIKNLEPGTTYVFRIRTAVGETAEKNGKGNIFTFKTFWPHSSNSKSNLESKESSSNISFVRLFIATLGFTNMSIAYELNEETQKRPDLTYVVDYRKKGTTNWTTSPGFPRLIALIFFIEVINLESNTDY